MTMASCFLIKANAQTLTQTVKGRVIDAQTTYSLPGANVVVLNTEPIIGTTTDAEGYFRLPNVPVGRHDIMVSFLGYKPSVTPNIQVNSAKEVYIEIKLEESVHQIEEAVVVGKRKEETINEMALISTRSFTVDEAARYAGSLNDPARMAQNFAGVAGSDDMRNDIIIRGNSPNGIIYRLEGVNIPNPNHLGTSGSSGGYYSMLTENTLDKSDFLTGAFPAQYGDALGGVFDINFRKGNNEKREYAFTFGMRGIEATAEGPFSPNSKASYLINYRYSTLAAFDALGLDLGVPAIPKYQDLSFKINIPVKAGYVKIFGMGGAANTHLKDSDAESPEEFFSLDKPSNIYSETGMSVLGASYKTFFNKNMYSKLTIAATRSDEIYREDTLAASDFKEPTHVRGGEFEENTYSLLYDFILKVDSKNKFVLGVQTDYLDLEFNEYNFFSNHSKIDHDGNTYKLSSYGQWMHKFTDELCYTLGLHTRYYDLTSSLTFEPRTSIKWTVNPKHSINAGFGVHSQGLPNYALFTEGVNNNGSTYYKYRDLSPSMSLHYIAGYNFQATKNLRIKLDAYYQDLYNVPVEENPSYWSAVNVGGDFNGFPESLGKLVNKGSGVNKGVELTIEKFLNQGYYYLITTSIFDSKYKGSDGIERNSKFNSNYVANILVGKEFKVGKTKQNTIGIDLKGTTMGGKRYIPINYDDSKVQNQVIHNYDNAYKDRHDDYLRFDLKFSYNLNKPNVSHQFILDLQNLTNNQNILKENYNISSGSFSYEYHQGFMPNIQYRILF